MKHSIIILVLLIFGFIPLSVYSQNYHTSSNKALKVYNEGLSAYDFFDYNRAEINFKEAINFDNEFYEAYMMLGELLSKQKRYEEAASQYRSAVKIDSLFYKPVYFTLANAEMMSGDYENALTHYKAYLAQTGMSEKNTILAEKNLKNCRFAIDAINNPVPFNPQNIGNAINTTDDEYWPSITADGHTMMFTRQPAAEDNWHEQTLPQEDFYTSYYVDNKWNEAYNAGAPLNTSQNEGAQSISSNGSYMYFTACNRSNGLGSCDIYFSSFNNGKWSEPSNLKKPVNSSYWESQPSVNANGRILFFSSNRQGGFGGKDIWFSRLNDNNEWATPVNLGNGINTEGDEMSPFIHFDGKTLYFASDGRVGMGGFDIYVSRLNSDSAWSEPMNLGYPINTFNDEMGLVIESGGTRAYYSSIRDNINRKDIFYFDLYKSVRPEPVSYLKGKVTDKETGMLLKAEYELMNLSTGEKPIKSSTDASGNFLVCLPSGFNYGLNVSKAGYLFYSENFMFEGEHTVVEPFIKRILLSPVKVGEKIVLSNVYYEVDSWELKKESISELTNLVSLLIENKDISLEIGGYTDSTGDEVYNQKLSEKRALSVVDYLISQGISNERLSYKGYGISSPRGDNITTEGRQLNRRTEAKVIEGK